DQSRSVCRIDDAGPGACVRTGNRVAYHASETRRVMKLVLSLTLAVTGFAETYPFEPREFHNTFSGAHKPVLRIKPGDHVSTMTIDAGGTDAKGLRRGQGPS